MKITKVFAATSIAVSILASTANSQTLGLTAASYDLFTFNSTNAYKDTTYMDFKEGGFYGLMGFGSGSENIVDADVGFGGELRWHTNLTSPDFDPTLLPGAVVNTRGAHDAELDLVNSQLLTYIDELEALTPTASFGNQNTAFTYNSSQDVTVLDFDSFDMDGSGDSIVLNGRSGFNDTIIIRSLGDSLWEKGAPVTLNNLDRRNVIWLAMNNTVFDLHKNDGANFEGVIINNNLESKGKGGSTIIGDVDFKGQVYASHIKLGTDVFFTGSSTFGPPIPEPSSVLLLMTACAGLMFRRSR